MSMDCVQIVQSILVSFPIYMIMYELSSWTLSSAKLLRGYANSRQKDATFQYLSLGQHFLIFTDVWYLCCFDLSSVYLIFTVCACSVYQCGYWPFGWTWILLSCTFNSSLTDLNLDWYLYFWVSICLPLVWLYDANSVRSCIIESY